MFIFIHNSRFPSDPATYPVDRQFLWGSSLLISPVLEQGASSVESVLPAGVWYDFYNVSGFKKRARCNGN